MKSKIVGGVVVSLLLVCILGSAAYAVNWHLERVRALALAQAQAQALEKEKAKGGKKGDPAAAKGADSVPEVDPAERKSIDELASRLNHLVTPGLSEAGGQLDFKLVGFSNSAVSEEQTMADLPSEDFGSRIVSMAFVSGDDKFAVIDDRLYREGDPLQDASGAPSSASIRTIEQDKVLIAGREVRQWVKVFNPVDKSKAKAGSDGKGNKAGADDESGGGGAAKGQAAGGVAAQAGGAAASPQPQSAAMESAQRTIAGQAQAMGDLGEGIGALKQIFQGR
ncbi:MAG: hypothetical protein HQL57_09010 [Magnetococcales bacterium]|nr:hypothetical protein [Magnetococcales bacterium]